MALPPKRLIPFEALFLYTSFRRKVQFRIKTSLSSLPEWTKTAPPQIALQLINVRSSNVMLWKTSKVFRI